VLLISPQCVVPEYRKRLEYLGERVTLMTLAPREFLDIFQNAGSTAVAGATSYDLRELETVFRSTSGTRCLLKIPPALWRSFQPDIVHVEQEIWSLSVFQALAYRRMFSPRASLVISTWENLPRRGLKGALLDRVFELIVPRASLILSVNQDGDRWVRQHGAGETRVIPQIGVDPVKFAPLEPEARRALRSRLGIAPDAFVACFVGRLVAAKGVADLVAAWKQVVAAQPEARLLLVGDGPLRQDLSRSGSSILLLPAVPRGETAPFFQASDVSVLASRTTETWKEQFGIAVLESLACGVPVLGSSSGAIPEVVGDGGLIFPEGDVPALAGHLLRLAQDARFRAELAARCRERIRRYYSNEVVAAGIFDAYRSIARRSTDSTCAAERAQE
jgi:glycosyltransferase involved in cell wall biosynthesis